MSEHEIIENGRYLVQSLQVLREYASATTTAPGQELDTRELSRFTDMLNLALSDIESIRDSNKSREASIIEREAEVEVLCKAADDYKLEMSKAAASSLELHNSAQATTQKLEDTRLAAERDRNTLLDALKSANAREQSLLHRENELTRREQTASQVKEAADESSRLATEALDTNSRLVTENESMQSRLNHQMEEASRAQQRAEEAEAEYRRSQVAFEQDKRDLEEARSQLDQEKKAAADSSAALDEEKRRVHAIKEQASSLKAEAERALQDARSQKSASEQLDRESAARRVSVDREKQLAEEAHKQAARDRDQVEAERDQVRKDHESALSLLKKIEDHYAHASQDRAATVSVLEAAWKERAQDRDSGAALLGETKAERARAHQHCTAAASLLQKASDQMARLDEDRAEVAYSAESARAGQTEDRAATASILQKANDVLAVSGEVAQKRIQDLEESRDALRDELGRKTAECQAKQAQCTSLRRDLDDRELAVRRAGENLEKAEERDEELKRTVRNLETRLQSAEDKAGALQDKADALQDQVRDLKSRLQTAEDRADTVQGQALSDACKRLRIEDENSAKVAADIEQLKKELANIKRQSDDDSAMLREKLSSAERDLQDMREQCKRLRTNRGNRELESRQGDDARREKDREDVPSEGSPWKASLHCVFEYLAGLNPNRSGSYGPNFRAIDDERLMRPLTYFLAKEDKRDRFTAFLGAGSKPDGWYCLGEICSVGHGGLRPVDVKCPSHEYNDCQLQVRHLDASSGGHTLDFRVPIPDDVDDEDDVDDRDAR